jgi:hypothetical protein
LRSTLAGIVTVVGSSVVSVMRILSAGTALVFICTVAVTVCPPTTFAVLRLMPVGDGGRTVTVAVAVGAFVPASTLLIVTVDVTAVRVTFVGI